MDSIDAAAFSPDGTQIMSGSRDKTIHMWDAESGAELLKLLGHKY
jgi:WD40 repeat protein